MKKILYLLILILSAFHINIKAQEVIEIAPLFEYPVAPDEMESLMDRCNYIVKHFWDNFNFKEKQPVDQYALNEAFKVYSSTFPYATKKTVDESLDNVIQKMSGNPLIQMQMLKAAEVNLYGPKASFWSDEVYLKFLDTVLKNKKITEARKVKYAKQASALKDSYPGQSAPTFKFTDKNGEIKNYFPMTTPTLLIFGNPDDTDWRLERLKMDSNFKLEDALSKGKINILFILPNQIENWQGLISNYNNHWTTGQSEEATLHYDTRENPSIYIVGSDGKIVNKFMTPQESVTKVLEMIN